MKQLLFTFLTLSIFVSCNNKEKENSPEEEIPVPTLEIGGDFSIMKKMEDSGGVYKINGEAKQGFEIFKENGYTWARLRIFHTPNIEGPVCNNLDYTIARAKKAKLFGFKIFLNFHYSDTWADPGKQFTPKAWENLSFETLNDSVYSYTKNVINTMDKAGVLPELVQVGNEINNGMLWPQGQLWVNGSAQWDNLSALLKSGIKGVKEANNGKTIPIMIHAATGGNLQESDTFYKNIIQRGVNFNVIGLSYYPWWHGTFEQLEANIQFISENYEQTISVVETAYYANGWYPEPAEWVLDIQPYPPTEQGQYDYLLDLRNRLKKYPKVTSVYYWKPDGLDIPSSKVFFLGRSLFDKNGNALKGISAWKTEE